MLRGLYTAPPTKKYAISYILVLREPTTASNAEGTAHEPRHKSIHRHYCCTTTAVPSYYSVSRRTWVSESLLSILFYPIVLSASTFSLRRDCVLVQFLLPQPQPQKREKDTPSIKSTYGSHVLTNTQRLINKEGRNKLTVHNPTWPRPEA